MSRLTKRNATLKASCKENSTYDCLLEDDCITCDCNNKILEKLAHYEDLEEAGRLIELPCKVGDTVWFIKNPCYKAELIETEIEKVVLKNRGLHIKMACNVSYETTCNSIGKTVFLTKAEAEAKLAEMGGE